VTCRTSKPNATGDTADVFSCRLFDVATLQKKAGGQSTRIGRWGWKKIPYPGGLSCFMNRTRVYLPCVFADNRRCSLVLVNEKISFGAGFSRLLVSCSRISRISRIQFPLDLQGFDLLNCLCSRRAAQSPASLLSRPSGWLHASIAAFTRCTVELPFPAILAALRTL
jgi:hypothetical protein